jgi:hypothetical protein
VHPHRRRGRLLLPFLAAFLLTPLACTDQPAEPEPPATGLSASAARKHPYRTTPAGQAAVRASAVKPEASLMMAGLTASAGPKVLILSDMDGPSTSALANAIAAAGYQVALRPAPEYTWDGTNPSLAGVATVIHLNGTTFENALPEAAQHALSSFVQNGGGFIGSQWNGYELTFGAQNQMPDLVLQAYGGPAEDNCAYCLVTFSTVAGQESHPVLAGIPSSFTYRADAHEAGPEIAFASNPSTVLMRVASGAPAVLAREFGSGKVVSFSFAPNYEVFDFGSNVPFDRATLVDPNVQQLYLNAVRWSAGEPGSALLPQTITFDALADRTFGDAPFAVSATASSALVVSFTATGSCTVAGTTVTTTSAGTCTITAHQSGDGSFEPADNVARSFTINPASPLIHWAAPAPISVGTPLGAAQLNATATGLGGVALVGTFFYDPPAGTLLEAGPAHTLMVQFSPSDPNYSDESQTTQIAVVEATSSLGFKGFFRPVRNLPARNRVRAGRAVTLRFSLSGTHGMDILQPGSAISRDVSCGASKSERTLEGNSSSRRSGLYYDRRSRRYSYVWKTDAKWAGTCRMFMLTLRDGTTHEALFRFVGKHRRGGNRERDDDD